jgi:hypothetical protein
MAKAANPKPPRVTIAEVEEFLSLEAERKELNRQAAVLAKRTTKLADAMFRLVKLNKGKPVTKGKHILAITTKNGRVQWKEEFVNVAGLEKALELSNNVPQVEALTVT